MKPIQSLVEEIKKEFVIWYRATSNVGSEPTSEWWKEKITDLLSKQRDIFAETIDETSIEAQFNFWQKPSDYQKGLVKNLKEKGFDLQSNK